jgi:hypothetical protein
MPKTAKLYTKAKSTPPIQKSSLGRLTRRAENTLQTNNTRNYKISHTSTHGCQRDLNLSPESWRLPHQVQRRLARCFIVTMTSQGPDWHDNTVPMLWRTRFTASTQPILLRMGPQSLESDIVLVLTLPFACCSSWYVVPGSKSASGGRNPWVNATVDNVTTLFTTLITNSSRILAVAFHCIHTNYCIHCRWKERLSFRWGGDSRRILVTNITEYSYNKTNFKEQFRLLHSPFPYQMLWL